MYTYEQQGISKMLLFRAVENWWVWHDFVSHLRNIVFTPGQGLSRDWVGFLVYIWPLHDYWGKGRVDKVHPPELQYHLSLFLAAYVLDLPPWRMPIKSYLKGVFTFFYVGHMLNPPLSNVPPWKDFFWTTRSAYMSQTWCPKALRGLWGNFFALFPLSPPYPLR